MSAAAHSQQSDALPDDIALVRAQCFEALDHLRAALDHIEHFDKSRSHISAAITSTVRAVETLPR